jgi:hypothetical protein
LIAGTAAFFSAHTACLPPEKPAASSSEKNLHPERFVQTAGDNPIFKVQNQLRSLSFHYENHPVGNCPAPARPVRFFHYLIGFCRSAGNGPGYKSVKPCPNLRCFAAAPA